MDSSCTAEDHFRHGQAALDIEDHDAALEHFRSAHRLEPTMTPWTDASS